MELFDKVKTVPINIAAATNTTIHTPKSGAYFVVLHLFIESSGANSLTFKSGSTALSGPIAWSFVTNYDIKNNGVPIFRGRSAGEAFVITTSDVAGVHGFAVVAETNSNLVI